MAIPKKFKGGLHATVHKNYRGQIVLSIPWSVWKICLGRDVKRVEVISGEDGFITIRESKNGIEPLFNPRKRVYVPITFTENMDKRLQHAVRVLEPDPSKRELVADLSLD